MTNAKIQFHKFHHEVPTKRLRYWDTEKKQYVVEPGDYEIPDSANNHSIDQKYFHVNRDSIPADRRESIFPGFSCLCGRGNMRFLQSHGDPKR